MYLWRKGIPMNHFFKIFNICCIKVKVKSFIDFELWISSISFMVPWGLGFGHLHWGLWRWELSFLSTTGMHSHWKKLSTASNLVGRPVRADDSTGSRFHYQGDAPNMPRRVIPPAKHFINEWEKIKIIRYWADGSKLAPVEGFFQRLNIMWGLIWRCVI